jgi:hypothetical protein
VHMLAKESTVGRGASLMTDVARYQQLIDSALAYREGRRVRKAFGKQFRQEPRIDQVFLKATATRSSTKT